VQLRRSSTIVLQVLPLAMSWQRATVTIMTVETHRLSDIWSTKIQGSRTQEANRSYQPCACRFTCGRIHYGRLAPLGGREMNTLERTVCSK
jgi:hypothetical protein